MNDFYNKIFLSDALGNIKQLKLMWNEEVNSEAESDTDLFYFNNKVDTQYSFIQEQVNDIIEKAISKVIVGLLKKSNRKPQYVKLKWESANVHKEDGNDDLYPFFTGKSGEILAYIEDEENERVLYIFKRYGLNYSVSPTLINIIKQEKRVDSVKYISYVTECAYKEILDTENPETTKNTTNNRYSLQYYMRQKFGDKEYDDFKESLDTLYKQIDDYLGIAVIRTLRPNALFGFKSKLKDDIKYLNYAELIAQNENVLHPLKLEQKALLDNQFRDKGYYKAIAGNSDFARSFITSEWFFISLQNPGYIDLTSIAMGYLKSAEQFLYDFMFLYTEDRTGDATHTFDAGRRHFLSLTKRNLKREKKFISLDNMTYFFMNNVTFLRDEIKQEQSTIRVINAILKSTKKLRNGFFHKDNIYEDDWDKVNNIRNNTLSLFYLFLGSYDLSHIDKIDLGIKKEFVKDDFYRLCEYTNKMAVKSVKQEIPILYIKGRMYRCVPDVDMEFDEEGIPLYSGVCICPIAPRDDENLGEDDYYCISKDEVPDEILEGHISIHMKSKLSIDPSGPERVVFRNGVFLAE